MDRTAYRTVDVNGLSVFYREAGPQDAPTILLLHGFPSSSRMWQPLLDRLADRLALGAVLATARPWLIAGSFVTQTLSTIPPGCGP
jgi:pimeloyl-ACP methyl ester carboxylesterase